MGATYTIARLVFAVLAAAVSAPISQHVALTRSVANVEHTSLVLRESMPAGLLAGPSAKEAIFYGQVMRRLPGESPIDSSHYVSFAASYSGGEPRQAWIDLNFNNTLADDPPVVFSSYPPIPRARCFLADLRWQAPADGLNVAFDWKVRIVLEPQTPGMSPSARVQHVYAMVGSVSIDGRPHRAFLLDGDGDGLYRRDFLDGLFVDLDDDRHFTVDPMSPEFAPAGVPFQMGSHLYEITALGTDGSWLVLSQGAERPPAAPPTIGALAPNFRHLDIAGNATNLSDLRGHPVIIHFWASWCLFSESQAPGMRTLHSRFAPAGLRILSISYDTDREAILAFQRKHLPDWPSSFSGRMFWEDPVGRLYQARWPGIMFLIAPDGTLDSVDDDPERIAQRVAALIVGR